MKNVTALSSSATAKVCHWSGLSQLAVSTCAALALVACGADGSALPPGETLEDAEATIVEEPAPTDDQQRLEQNVRARLVADLDPVKGGDWDEAGTARFESFTSRTIELKTDQPSRGTREEDTTAVLVLADGRRFTQKQERFLAPEFSEAAPAVLDEDLGDPRVGRAQIGADTRVQISPTTSYPARAVGALLSSSTGKSHFCTAALISPRVAVTAGHCIYNTDTNSWAWNTWFSPGHNGQGANRYPNGAPRKVVGLLSFGGWVNHADADHDVGYIILEDKQETASLGWFGFGWWSGSLDDVFIGMYQYPQAISNCADSPLATGKCGSYQYWGSSTIDSQCGNLLRHKIDTNPGSSGSPTYRWWKGGRWIVGPHAYGLSPCGGSFNKSVRLGKYKAGVGCQLTKDFPSVFADRKCG